jgi:hypothetical protein
MDDMDSTQNNYSKHVQSKTVVLKLHLPSESFC